MKIAASCSEQGEQSTGETAELPSTFAVNGRQIVFPLAPSGCVHKAHLPRLRALWMCERQINFTV